MDQSTAERVAVYCKVWGFLKYYHPGVANKAVNWDNAFLHHYPEVKQCTSKAQLNEILWMLYERVNAVEPAEKADDDRSITAGTPITDFTWLLDTSLFERKIRDALWDLKKQGVSGKNFYVQGDDLYSPYLHSQNFERDNGYYTIGAPDESQRLLALARYWNVINYYAANKTAMSGSWDALLFTFVPRIADATDSLKYLLTMVELSRNINDRNSAIENETLLAHVGEGTVPVDLNYIEGKTVVTGASRWMASADSLMAEVGLFKGDIILSINGVSIGDRRTALLPLVTLSNPNSSGFELSMRLLRGKPGDTVRIVVDGFYSRREVVTTFRSFDSLRHKLLEPGKLIGSFNHDKTIAYVDVSKFKEPRDAYNTIENLKGTRGLILDHRYGATFMIGHLLTTEKRFAEVRQPNYKFPGYLQKAVPVYVGWTHYTENAKNRYVDTRVIYRGRIVVLVDEATLHEGERSAMALQAIPGAVTIGSQTAGGPALQSAIRLPGKLKLYFSGSSIFYPDKTPVQRIGLKIDHEVRPTIQGLREGRDEVLEYALEYLEALEKDD